VNQEATKVIARAKRIAGALGVPSRSTLGEGHVDIAALERSMIGLPGVVEDGMPGANEQRKPGTARGSPRRSRTAKASRISRHAVKSRCAREWGGWGRLSDDGPGHYNPDPSEGPWGGGDSTKWRCAIEPTGPTQSGAIAEVTRRTKDGRKPDTDQRMPGAGLSWPMYWEGPV
jgi:hypothetical protein